MFAQIYEDNVWGDSESGSGANSTESATRELRGHLLKILSQFHVKSIVDAPCGDFNWMRLVRLDENIRYTGLDKK